MGSSPGYLKGSSYAVVLAAAQFVMACSGSPRTTPEPQHVDAGHLEDTGAALDAEEPPTLDVEVLPPVVSDCPSRDGMIGARLKEGDCFLIDAKSVSRGEYFDALRRDELRPASHPACIAVMGRGDTLMETHGSRRSKVGAIERYVTKEGMRGSLA